MPAFTGALARFVADSYGVVTDDQLRELDISVKQRKALVADGVLVTEFDRVYRVAAVPPTLLSRSLAVCLARDDAAITGRAAGRLWDLRRMGPIDRIEVRLPHFAQTLSGPDILLRRCNVLDEVDVVTRADGIRVVSPPRLLFDLGAVVDDLDLESVIEQVLDRGWVTMPTLFATGRRLCHPSRPGSDRFARVVQSRPTWMKPADSHLEVELYDRLRVAGVNGLERQFPITLPTGVTVHADIAVPELSWAIEVDHVTWHGGRIASRDDKARDRLVRKVDWQVDRVTDDEIRHQLPALVAELLAIHHQLRSQHRIDRRVRTWPRAG